MTFHSFEINPIAIIHTDFPEKFGIPRQSGLVPQLKATIVFEPAYRKPEYLREITSFSHLWIIWLFSEALNHEVHPTVRPPRLGGNQRVGVFASRSPFRPNHLGLSCVKLDNIIQTKDYGTILQVSGADILDGTPIFDIKPYIPVTDCHPEAADGYTAMTKTHKLDVEISANCLSMIPENKKDALIGILSCDPRPGYDNDPQKTYGLFFSNLNISFRVENNTLIVLHISSNNGTDL